MSFAPILMSNMPISHDNVFIYGAPGCGKTVFAAGSQKRRTFYFNIENGYKSILTWRGDPASGYTGCRPELIHSTPVIKTLEGFLSAWDYLCKNHKNYEVMVFDTATEFAKVVMADNLKRRNKMIPEQQDWGVVQNRLEWLFREMRNLPLTKITLAHENVKVNPATQQFTFGPQFQGQIRFDYAKHFDEIWRFMLVQQQVRDASNSVQTVTHRLLQTAPDQNTEGKTRSNALAFFEYPILDALLYKMQGA